MITQAIGRRLTSPGPSRGRMADFAARIDMTARLETIGARSAGQRAKAFAAAARHSAYVRFLRVALLGGAIGTVAVLVGIALFDPFGRLRGGVSISGIGVEGTKVTMEHPRLAGFRKDGRAYLVNAQKAIQDALQPSLVELHGIDADIALAAGGAAHMTADSGFYDSSKEHMDVSQNVRLKSPQYDVLLKSASIDFRNGLYASKEPVTIVTTNGTTLSGDAISAVDNGKELTIEGHVRTMIPPASAVAETHTQLKDTVP
jgi:lipopolysaccharide export system protein LptC